LIPRIYDLFHLLRHRRIFNLLLHHLLLVAMSLQIRSLGHLLLFTGPGLNQVTIDPPQMIPSHRPHHQNFPSTKVYRNSPPSSEVNPTPQSTKISLAHPPARRNLKKILPQHYYHLKRILSLQSPTVINSRYHHRPSGGVLSPGH
jgi:hypothetical protein